MTESHFSTVRKFPESMDIGKQASAAVRGCGTAPR
jgi:hypothetical protein